MSAAKESLSDRALRRLLAMAAEEDAGAGAADDDPSAGLPPLPPRYRIVREIGRGGMGIVYEALDVQLGRHIALKRIGAAAGAGDELRRRFAREALAAARLRHPHIAAVHDATPDFLCMQLIHGAPIDTIDRRERRLIVELVRDAGRALHHAHQSGIVHRDVKPSNLLVEGRHVYVVDFGLAKELADAGASLSGVVGTPAYMAPEQAQGKTGSVDARTDVYSLGATLHRCLVGAPPFSDPDLPTLLRRVVEEEPPPAGVERDLDLVIAKSLAKEPERRYAGADALADDLDRWLRHEPVVARRPSFAYRMRKLLERRRVQVRAVGLAALAAVAVTALVLGPIAWRERTARAAASEAVALSDYAVSVLEDATHLAGLGDMTSAHEALDGGIATARAFLGRHEVARVRLLLSRLLRARGLEELALLEVERALDLDPALAEARFARGLALAAKPELTDAERARAIADLQAEPPATAALSDVERLLGRAELDRLESRPEQAMARLQEVLAYDPGCIAARNALVKVALTLGEAALAMHYSASAVDFEQGHGPIYVAQERFRLPTTLLGLDAALVNFAPQLADGPDLALAIAQRATVQLRRALRHETEGDRGRALAAARAALEDCDTTLSIHPELAGALNNRAACRLVEARLLEAGGDAAAAATARAQARDDLRRAVLLAPDLADALFNWGALLRRHATTSLEHLEADALLRRALDRAPPGWPHVRAATALLREEQVGSR